MSSSGVSEDRDSALIYNKWINLLKKRKKKSEVGASAPRGVTNDLSSWHQCELMHCYAFGVFRDTAVFSLFLDGGQGSELCQEPKSKLQTCLSLLSEGADTGCGRVLRMDGMVSFQVNAKTVCVCVCVCVRERERERERERGREAQRKTETDWVRDQQWDRKTEGLRVNVQVLRLKWWCSLLVKSLSSTHKGPKFNP